MGWLALGSPLGSTLQIQKFMSLSLHLELADLFDPQNRRMKIKVFPKPPLNVWFRVAEHKSRFSVPEQPTGCSFKRDP